MKLYLYSLVALLGLVGCDDFCKRVEALDEKAWECSEWISVAAAPVAGKDETSRARAADGTSCFWQRRTNRKAIQRARWMTTGLGVYTIFVNGTPIGQDFLKPGYTHGQKTKRSFTYDITSILRTGSGEVNDFGVEVSAGWWRDRIVNYLGRKSAFRGVLEFDYEDGTKEIFGTQANEWYGEIAGPVTHAGIFDGEEYDARLENCARRPRGTFAAGGCEKNNEFKGEILPTAGAEVALRYDLAMRRGPYVVRPGETVTIDFGQNCAAVPHFSFRAKRGTILTALPSEMLNDADKGQRGCDGPKGTIYRANYRIQDHGMRLVYTFGSDEKVDYAPTYTFFGYRYLALTATDTVEVDFVESIPVSSITREMETGTLETGLPELNRFIANVYWGQLSNYLSVPTDCPQRDERLGWMADTQVFAEAGAFNADTSLFLRKWMRDVCDTQLADGSFTSVAPYSLFTCWDGGHRLGWADAGIIVPWTVWKMFADTEIINENWHAMERFLAMQDQDQYVTKGQFQFADWLSFEDYETCNGSAYVKDEKGKLSIRREATMYWDFLAGCYWFSNARMMSEMAGATGRTADVEKYRAMAVKAKQSIIDRFVDQTDGLLIKPFRHLQGAAVFALHFDILPSAKAREATARGLVKNITDHGGCLQTGFLGTSFLMDALVECGEIETCYTLLLQRKCPSWLYSVDQGATTIWERWNSYTKKDGFGPVEMNSFNHYAYGQVLGWIYRHVAGIAADTSAPGFKNIIMAPKPDRRLGFVKAEYKSRAGLITSAWRYEGDKWIWDFTIPEGATALVTLPGETEAKSYSAGSYHFELFLSARII